MKALTSLFTSDPPCIAVEISSHSVTAVSLTRDPSRPTISGHAFEGLPPGAVVPSLNASNVSDSAALTAAIRRTLDRLPVKVRRIVLILPDIVAKVSLVRFETVPAKNDDLERLIRWQVRKAAPFRIEDAQVAYASASAVGSNGREFVVTQARRDIIEEYEAACTAAHVHAGVVDLVTLNLINTVVAGGQVKGDWLLVNLEPAYSSLAVIRDKFLIFFRNRTNDEAGGDFADLVHQTAMYYEDRLSGAGFSQVVISGAGADFPRLKRELEERLRSPVQSLETASVLSFANRVSANPDLATRVAPLVGALLKEQEATG